LIGIKTDPLPTTIVEDTLSEEIGRMFHFQLAVIGPTAVRGRFGVASGCAQCVASQGEVRTSCGGFGPGCLGARPRASEPLLDPSLLGAKR
jgi:hypothetical protein